MLSRSPGVHSSRCNKWKFYDRRQLSDRQTTQKVPAITLIISFSHWLSCGPPPPLAIDLSQLAWGKMHSCTQINLKFKNESWYWQPAVASGTILPPDVPAWVQIWLTWLQLLYTSWFFAHSWLVATPRIQHILEPEISLVSLLINEKFPHKSLVTLENTRLNNN